MNRQGKLINSRWEGGIEWTHVKLPDGRQLPGYTWNPIGGCRHGCEWTMPDGQQAICYAKTTAETLAQGAYPEGFEAHYWRPDQLRAPLGVKDSAGIFLDSMSDLWGAVVPAEQIVRVLEIATRAHWHIFQSLTKNAPRLLQFPTNIPTNVWLGVSSPPDVMFGERLTPLQQEKFLARALEILQAFPRHITWMSFEPYSRDYASLVAEYIGPWQQTKALNWAVIGAASNGTTIYDPDPEQVERLVGLLDACHIPLFFKGNMRRFCRAHGVPWREEFPTPVGWVGGKPL